MAETRVQIAYHWKTDPAQLIPGAIRIPDLITRTVAVGDEFMTEKVSSSVLTPADRAALMAEINKQTVEANRVALPAEEGASAQSPGPAEASETEDEISAF